MQSTSARTLYQLVRNPVSSQTSNQLAKIWSELKPEFRTDQQMVGRHEEGCGATIGVMPRCDFPASVVILGKMPIEYRNYPLEK